MYYSSEGNTRAILEKIAGTVSACILKLCPEKETGTRGFMKFMWGESQDVFKKTPKLKYLDKNSDDYDVTYIGTPV